jgi:DNA-binding XRE family transcriptional regulator
MKSKSPASAKSESKVVAEIDDDRYDPVPIDPAKRIAHKLKTSATYRAAHDALKDEFAALEALLAARKSAGLTQTQVAARMGVSQPVLARIEGSLGSRKHSPSLATLRRYAEACGKKLVIRMI